VTALTTEHHHNGLPFVRLVSAMDGDGDELWQAGRIACECARERSISEEMDQDHRGARHVATRSTSSRDRKARIIEPYVKIFSSVLYVVRT
jgi:hypothetical protein